MKHRGRDLRCPHAMVDVLCFVGTIAIGGLLVLGCQPRNFMLQVPFANVVSAQTCVLVFDSSIYCLCSYLLCCRPYLTFDLP